MGYFDFVVSEIHGLRIKELNDQRAKATKSLAHFAFTHPKNSLTQQTQPWSAYAEAQIFPFPTLKRFCPETFAP